MLSRARRMPSGCEGPQAAAGARQPQALRRPACAAGTVSRPGGWAAPRSPSADAGLSPPRERPPFVLPLQTGTAACSAAAMPAIEAAGGAPRKMTVTTGERQ